MRLLGFEKDILQGYSKGSFVSLGFKCDIRYSGYSRYGGGCKDIFWRSSVLGWGRTRSLSFLIL